MQPKDLEALEAQWTLNHDALSASALARALLHQHRVEARVWAVRALRANAESLPLQTARQCAVPLVALPSDAQTASLCAIDDERCVSIPLAVLPCPATSYPTVEPDGSVWALIDPSKALKSKRTTKPFQFYVFDPNHHTDLLDPSTLTELPRRFRALCAAKRGPSLFVSGSDLRPDRGFDQTASLGWRDLSAEPWHWQGINKSFDDLVIRDQTLIAVDNLVIPKYFFLYDLSEGAPCFIRSVEIPHHTTNAHIFGFAHDERFVALLSEGANRSYRSQIIAIYDLNTLTERVVTSQGRAGRRPDPSWNHIALCNDHLLIAAGRAGVIAVRLSLPSIATALDNRTIPSRRRSSLHIDLTPETAHTAFRPPEGSSALRVITHPNTRTAFAVCADAQGLLRSLPFAVSAQAP